ncbi:MAG: serine/threonine-protein kinase [Planctomycetota bacterium]|nr:serine/threonine-protein kinase [Planctomycetota bacterium]
MSSQPEPLPNHPGDPGLTAAQTLATTPEELLAVLVGHGLIDKEEAQLLKGPLAEKQTTDASQLVRTLVKLDGITKNQARRLFRDLASLREQQIPGYILSEKLGSGAGGAVYRAKQVSMNREVAIKLLHGRLAKNPEYLKRFVKEAHVAARCSHNNIVQAIDVGSAGGAHYFVMELIQGKTIVDFLKGSKPIFEEKEATEIILQIAQALEHAARRSLVHRDIKPSNIMLTAEGVAKLADLGLAREATDQETIERERGLTIGTPFYIAPEQIKGKDDIDSRADIYSLGATFYHMVTGRPPFEGANVHEVIEKHLREPLIPPDHLNHKLSSGVGEVIEIMMAKECKGRYQKPEDLVIDLECLLNNEAPKLARKRIKSADLGSLSEGETYSEEVDSVEMPGWVVPTLATMGGVLVLSLFANLVLALR